MRTFGLIGKSLSHSFSANYFHKKFYKEGITDAKYINFEINDISDIKHLIKKQKPAGLNITIPYKESIIPFLDQLTEDAKSIEAVNTIEFKDNKLIGHNTDIVGFRKSIEPLLNGRKSALILGNGGAAKAIILAFKQLNISFKIVARGSLFNYDDISNKDIDSNKIIINTTPLGMSPNNESYPKIPYEALTEEHLLFDLIYNPIETLFLKYGKKNGSHIKNGLEMLQIQAKASWNIWNNEIVKY